jgi:hypothetical protein
MTEAQEDSRERLLTEMLSIIQRNPGIRPSEINRILGRPHTAHYRNLLIQRGLVRKERDGSMVHYYAEGSSSSQDQGSGR